MRASALNGIHGDGKINLAKGLDIEVSDGIPAVMNSDGCALNGSAWFVNGATFDRSDSTLLIRHDVESEPCVTFNLPDRILARNSHVHRVQWTSVSALRRRAEGAAERRVVIRRECGKLDQARLTGDRIRPRKGHSCVYVGNILYAFGGKTESGKYLNDLVIINTTIGEVRC
jgi:hypothetical protein